MISFSDLFCLVYISYSNIARQMSVYAKKEFAVLKSAINHF